MVRAVRPRPAASGLLAMNRAWPMARRPDRPTVRGADRRRRVALGRGRGATRGRRPRGRVGPDVADRRRTPTGCSPTRCTGAAWRRPSRSRRTPTHAVQRHDHRRRRAATLDEAPGQQGHLFGTRHAERWAWAHCGDFDGDDGRRPRRSPRRAGAGRLPTPFITSVGAAAERPVDPAVEGVARSARRRLGAWRIDLGDKQFRLTGRVEAPTRRLMRARYLDPDGTPRWCHNCEIASSPAGPVRAPRRRRSRRWRSSSPGGTTHAEWAGRTPGRRVRRPRATSADRPARVRDSRRT